MQRRLRGSGPHLAERGFGARLGTAVHAAGSPLALGRPVRAPGRAEHFPAPQTAEDGLLRAGGGGELDTLQRRPDSGQEPAEGGGNGAGRHYAKAGGEWVQQLLELQSLVLRSCELVT